MHGSENIWKERQVNVYYSASLKRKVDKDQAMHRGDNVRITNENVVLIKEINKLRRDIKDIKQKERIPQD
jgi:hypothetical protein